MSGGYSMRSSCEKFIYYTVKKNTRGVIGNVFVRRTDGFPAYSIMRVRNYKSVNNIL